MSTAAKAQAARVPTAYSAVVMPGLGKAPAARPGPLRRLPGRRSDGSPNGGLECGHGVLLRMVPVLGGPGQGRPRTWAASAITIGTTVVRTNAGRNSRPRGSTTRTPSRAVATSRRCSSARGSPALPAPARQPGRCRPWPPSAGPGLRAARRTAHWPTPRPCRRPTAPPRRRCADGRRAARRAAIRPPRPPRPARPRRAGRARADRPRSPPPPRGPREARLLRAASAARAPRPAADDDPDMASGPRPEPGSGSRAPRRAGHSNQAAASATANQAVMRAPVPERPRGPCGPPTSGRPAPGPHR